MRLLVKTLHEDEQDGVIHVHPEDDDLISELHSTLASALEGRDVHVDAKLAASAASPPTSYALAYLRSPSLPEPSNEATE